MTVRIHLLDGTYELFRHYYAVPKHTGPAGEVGATRAVVGSVLTMFEDGVTHLGVATDHVIESFRNELWPGYKSSAGVEPTLLAQFPILEDALRALGVVVWPMVELEADDALASAAVVGRDDPRVEQVLVCTPDKDLAQCVAGRRVVQFDRRKRAMTDEAGVVARYGVGPASIPDYLALVGDSSDGFPGLAGWGPKAASALLAQFEHIERIPDDPMQWGPGPIRGARALAGTLAGQRHLALLFKDLATLRTTAAVGVVDDLAWTGPTPELGPMAARLDAPDLALRAKRVAERVARRGQR